MLAILLIFLVCLTLILIWNLWELEIQTRVFSELNLNLYIRVKRSPRTHFLTAKMLEKMIDRTICFWSACKKWTFKDIKEALEGTEITFYDQTGLRIGIPDPGNKERYHTISALGVCYPDTRTIAISTLQGARWNRKNITKHVEETLHHELSHLILGYITNDWTVDTAHELFNELGI